MISDGSPQRAAIGTGAKNSMDGSRTQVESGSTRCYGAVDLFTAPYRDDLGKN